MVAVRISGPEGIQGVSADPAPVPRYPIADAADFGGASAAAEQNLGAAISAIGDHLAERRRAATDTVAHDTASLDYATAAQKATLDLQNQYPSGGQGFTDALKQKLDDLKPQVLDGLSNKGLSMSPVGLDALNSHFTQVQQNYLLHGVTFENNAQVANLTNTLGKNVDAVGADVYSSGDVDAGLKRLDQTISAGRGFMPAPDLDKFADTSRKKLITQGIDGYLARGAAASAAGDADGAQKFYDQADTIRRKYLGDEGNPDQQSGVGVLPANIAPRVQQHATAAGLNPDLVSRVVQIESGGNPNASTGSYKGLMQLSQAEFNKYGGGDIFNPDDNLRAGIAALKDHIATFQSQFGRAPTATELYLAHQQGDAGLAAHEANPDAPAWQNMFSTGEGKQKGEAWAKQAIWGNLPQSAKGQFGSVDNVTSRDFMNVWQRRVEGGAPISTTQAKGGTQYASADTGVVSDAGPQGGSEQSATDPGQENGPSTGGALVPDAALSFQLKGRIQTARNASTVDQERRIRLQQQQAKQQSDAEEQRIIGDVFSDNPQETAQSVSQNTKLAPGAQLRMIATINRADKPDPFGKVSAHTAMSLLDRMRLPDGDPNKITDTAPIYDAYSHGDGVNSGLSKGDLKFLVDQFNSGASTDGSSLSKMKKKFTDDAKEYFNMQSIMSGGLTTGAGAFSRYEFERYVEGKVQDARDNKKNPASLFDPMSQDYLGKADATGTPIIFKNFKQSMQQQTRDAAKPAPSSNTPPVDRATERARLDAWMRARGGVPSPVAQPQVPISQ